MYKYHVCMFCFTFALLRITVTIDRFPKSVSAFAGFPQCILFLIIFQTLDTAALCAAVTGLGAL